MAVDKILMTDADGLIGSHLAESIVRAGYSVCAFAIECLREIL